MLALVEMMYSETQIPYPKMAVVRDLLKALFTMIEAESEKDNPEEKNFARTQNAAFRVFLKILEENFRRPEGVDFYSEKLFMSSRNLNLLCQKIINKSVSDLIITRRLIEARNLLIYTDKTVSEIGFELGYNEKSYFTNAFKKETRLTPTAFREEMHKLIS
jgi:AraC-like DNA-binding protein